MRCEAVSQVLEFDAPCCASVRECAVRALYVIGLRGEPRILRRIGAVRCYRGITKKIKFYPSENVILVHYYVSNRGVHYVHVLWKPETLTNEQAVEIARKALGLSLEETIHVTG
jgi:hypothetical protein